MNLPSESWHNHFAVIQAVDQAVRLRSTVSRVYGCEEHDDADSFQLHMFACCFKLIFRLFINTLTINLCVFGRNNPALQGEHFCLCSLNISMLHVSEYAIQGADWFVAP